MSRLEPDIASEIAWRVGSDSEWTRWRDQMERTHYCHRPIRLKGTTYGEDGAVIYSTATEPGGVLMKACGNRRESICPPCSRTYKGDLWQLVIAGLIGGKGVPASVADHPMVFVTFTAPSFGAVHGTHPEEAKCRPRRGNEHCEHGVKLACWRSHSPDSPEVGQPICLDCFDYEGALIWNALAPELWRRTTIYIKRALANELGLTATAFTKLARVSFLKVAEYQRRGLLHFHAVIRLDAIDDATSLPRGISAADLAAAVRRAAGQVGVPGPAGDFAEIGWGRELDIARLGGDGAIANRTAAYVAKYATKSTEVVGGLTRPISSARAAELDISEHVRRFIEAAHELGGREDLVHLHLAKCVHQLGFRGHWTTKSRRYSTTLAALREARQIHASGQVDASAESSWQFAGAGHATRAELVLASSLASEEDRTRRIARVEIRSEVAR